jgi:molybdate transport system ATP-binding protein
MALRAVSVEAAIGVELGDAAHGTFELRVDLHVDDGETLAVLGPNGAGKSTLLRVLAGLVAIDAGSVTIGGRLVDDPAAEIFVPAEQRGVGFVFQDYLLFPHLSVIDNVAFGLRARGVRRGAARERAARLLSDVGLAGKAAARPRELSGGEAQRVAFLRAAAIEPVLFLLDEPLAALDVQTRAEMRAALRRSLAVIGGARILVTHDPVDALTLADRLLILEGGRVVQSGTTPEIVAHPRSSYVADLVGMNLYHGRADGEVVHVDSVPAGATLTTVEPHDGPVLAIIAPHSVFVYPECPHGSARNVWPGTIATIDRLGARVRIRIDGAFPIVAEVTPAAVETLDLREGTSVWAAVKATDIDVFVD